MESDLIILVDSRALWVYGQAARRTALISPGRFSRPPNTAGQFTRAAAADPTSSAYRAGLDAVFSNTDTAMGHVWLVTAGNSRADQIATGADWLRVNLAVTSERLGFQPLSQALQEFPEMADAYATVHKRLAPTGGTVQMLSRIGFPPCQYDVRHLLSSI